MKRDATAGDLDAIARIHVASWRAAYRGILPEGLLAEMSERRQRDFWAKMLENPFGKCVVWERESRVVGFADFGRVDGDGSVGIHWELYVIYLTPELYGSGEGTRFWREIEAELGAGCVWVWVLEENVLGRRFYEKNGFARVEGEVKVFEWKGRKFPEIRYRKFL